MKKNLKKVNNPEGPDPTTQPLSDHLDELRSRLIRCVIAGVVGLAVVLPLVPLIIKWLQIPLAKSLSAGSDEVILRTLAPAEALIIMLRVALVGGLVLASPFVLREVWLFVAPGLSLKEKKGLYPAFFSGLVLFLGGSSFAYFVILPLSLGIFLANNQLLGLEAAWTLERYLVFSLRLLVAFGVVFELPVVLSVLGRAGLVTPQGLSKYRRYVILGIFLVAAILTPPDVFTQIALGLPLWALYEATLLWMRFRNRKKKK